MHITARICRILLWITLVITTTIQGLALVAIQAGNRALAESESRGEPYNWIPLLVLTVLMVAAVVLFFAVPKGKTVFFIATAVVGVLFILIALNLAEYYTVKLNAVGADKGLTVWRMISRHMTPALIPLFMLPSWLCYHAERKAEKRVAVEEPPASYFDLLDKSFRMSALEDEPTPGKAKRSVRHRQRKETQNKTQ